MAEPETDEKKSDTGAAKEDDRSRMSLVDHLDELRSRIIYVLIAVTVASVACWFITPPALNYLISKTGKVIVLGIPDAFMWRLKLSIIFGVIVSSPLILYQIWLFVRPGLMPGERRFAFPMVFFGTLLFFGGAVFGSFVVPMTISFLEGFLGELIEPSYSLDKYLSFVGTFIMAFDIVFELPIVLLLLAKMGIVSYTGLAKNRKMALIIALVVGAVLTPADVASMFFLAVPLYLLFEISLLIMRFMKKPGQK